MVANQNGNTSRYSNAGCDGGPPSLGRAINT
jgi:hypothetical protein